MRNEAAPELARLVVRPCCPSVHPFGRPCESTPWKLRGCWLHTIPLLSLTLQLSAHQEWEGNKPGMALHPYPYLDTFWPPLVVPEMLYSAH
jgi:hypothetical protein